jgi:DNA modification methylase
MSALRNTILHANCIHVMREMPDQSVDFIVPCHPARRRITGKRPYREAE